MPRQTTLAQPMSLAGIGLHSGEAVRVELRPARAGTGVVFRRLDQPDWPPLPARWDRVVDTRFATTLGCERWQVSTVEHLLAAIAGVELDNVEVWLDGSEPPAVDGSAGPWVRALLEAGLEELEAERKVLALIAPVEVSRGASRLRLVPSDVLELAVEVDFPHPQVGRQRVELTLANGTFAHEVAWARTFAFEHEIDALRAAGLAQGGSLDNAVVFGEDGPLNDGGLRHPEEAVRHKMLDLLGDLSLVGHRLRARVEAVRPGHAVNQLLVQALANRPDAWRLVNG